MTSIKLTAPAKVNLFLKVLNKRKDSYHNILTLFERITLADDVRISKIPKGIKLSCDKFITRNPKDNIAYKAAELILRKKRLKSGVEIDIRKRIPIGAGLGGGSSDAASVLKGMNKLFGLRLGRSALMGLARLLGADVPFFVSDAPFAIGRSRGDKLKPVKLKARLWHIIICPNFHISTKEVYETLDFALTEGCADAKINLPLRGSMDFGALEGLLHNDLESVVLAKKRAVGRIIERLATSLGKKAIVSGSGPSVFCLYETGKEAMAAKRKFLSSVPAKESGHWQVFVVGTKR